MDKALYITEFANVEDAIVFANKFVGIDSDAIEALKETTAELDDDKRWLFMIGVCDICGAEELSFVPAVIFEDEISAVECSECGNMSIYPKEAETS